MTFRQRVTLLAAAAVAVAVLGAAALLYVVLQQELLAQVDGTLVDAATNARQFGPRPGDRFPQFGGSRGPLLSGRPDIFAQVVDRSGNVVRADGGAIPALVSNDVKAVAARQKASTFAEIEIEGIHLRLYTVPFGTDQALELARPLDEIDRVLGETRLRLILVGLGGVMLAAALGAAVARGALAPVKRLTVLIEEVTRTRDLSRRVAVDGAPDELGRLAASFNAMLTALEASLRSQRQLVADASHELRTPLTSLRTNLELLARGQPTDEADRRALLVDLVGQMERLSTLVADLIDLARDEETEPVREIVKLDELVTEAVVDIRGRYPTVRFEVASEPTTVNGVRPRMARAITNLLDNAGKWSPSGGVVDVAVGGGQVVVRDHGPGVAPEDSQRVFDRFWRAANARHLPGSGLGLAIVRDVAEAHGGSVTLERPPGGGARFILRLA